MRTQKINLGNRITKARKCLGLHQKDIEKLTGIDQAELSRYENDVTQPGIENLVKLCKVFKMTLDYLLFGEF